MKSSFSLVSRRKLHFSGSAHKVTSRWMIIRARESHLFFLRDGGKLLSINKNNFSDQIKFSLLVFLTLHYMGNYIILILVRYK